MKRIYTILLALFCFLPLTSMAETLPSLKALDMPDWGSIETSPDTEFAAYLEEQKDYSNAILEWKRVLYNAVTPQLKEKAIFHIASLQQMTGEHSKAIQTYEKLGLKFPKTKHLPEAMYRMSLSADYLGLKQGTLIRNRLSSSFPKTEWPEKANYAYLWHRAYQGIDELPDIGSERGKDLLDRLKDYPARPEAKAWQSTMFSFIPGLGHLYLDDWRTALMAFLINGVFIASLIYSLRFKLWAYASIFGLIVSILYVGTLFSAHSLTYREALEERIKAMQQWDELKPEHLFTKPKQVSVINPLEAPLWFYRNIVGKFDGERSGGWPVSSYYMAQAQQEFGMGVGTLMGIDRLLRDWREIETPHAQIFSDGKIRYWDPVKRNSFWIEKS